MKERDYSISLLRIIAMFMIIGCHIASFLNNNIIAMILNVGVEIFLIISGYLYSNKVITNNKKFILKRSKKIMKPLIITTVMYIIFAILTKKIINIIAIPFLLCNLQGINFLISAIKVPQIEGLSHMWFLTVILLCYLLLILVKELENRYEYKYSLRGIILLILVLVGLDLLFIPLGIQLGYFLTFFIGYILGKIELKIINKMYMLSTLIMILSLTIRLLGRHLFDGSIFYANIIVIFTQILLALWFFFSVKWFISKFIFFDRASKSDVVKILDSYSFYVYLTHYMFIVGTLSVRGFINGTFLQLLAIVLLTVFSAFVVKVIDNKVF